MRALRRTAELAQLPVAATNDLPAANEPAHPSIRIQWGPIYHSRADGEINLTLSAG